MFRCCLVTVCAILVFATHSYAQGTGKVRVDALGDPLPEGGYRPTGHDTIAACRCNEYRLPPILARWKFDPLGDFVERNFVRQLANGI